MLRQICTMVATDRNFIKKVLHIYMQVLVLHPFVLSKIYEVVVSATN